MKKATLKNIVYKQSGEFEIYLETDSGQEMNYFVNNIDGQRATSVQLNSLKGKQIFFDIHKEQYTNSKSSIDIETN
ncbi:MAG: hypothetical protein IM600_12250 [Bacteroidetes bacterium]|nr:hypothetical protein [Bacteroidota bacterium]MCA6444193.1 hypothetical protein [Bacteroidota bacterium]